MAPYYHWYLENSWNLEDPDGWGRLWSSNDSMDGWLCGAGLSPLVTVHQSHHCTRRRQRQAACVKYFITNGDIWQQQAAVIDLLDGKDHCLSKAKFSEIYPETKWRSLEIDVSWLESTSMKTMAESIINSTWSIGDVLEFLWRRVPALTFGCG